MVTSMGSLRYFVWKHKLEFLGFFIEKQEAPIFHIYSSRQFFYLLGFPVALT